MDDVFVARLMSSSLHTVTADALVEEAAQLMIEEEIGSVVVVGDDGTLEGILTTTDFVKIVAERRPKDRTPVSAYMTSEVITATAQESVPEVANRLLTYGIHHLPVVTDDGEPVGMLTTTDLAAYVASFEAAENNISTQ